MEKIPQSKSVREKIPTSEKGRPSEHAGKRQLSTLKKGDVSPDVEKIPQREKGLASKQAGKQKENAGECFNSMSFDSGKEKRSHKIHKPLQAISISPRRFL